MKIIGILVLNSLLVALVLFGISQAMGQFTTVRSPSPSLNTSPPPLPPFNLLTLQGDGEGRTIQNCRDRDCRPLDPPGSVQDEPVTDGEFWYYYTPKQDHSQREIIVLVRQNISTGEVSTILEQTPLAKPHGLFISPDNQKVAFWLDNTTDSQADLTELWTYDTKEQGTSVVAEKLVASAILTPPRWNRSSTLIYFLGDNAEKGADPRPELLTVTLKPPSVKVSFLTQDWAPYLADDNLPVLDISADGRQVAYMDRSFFRRQLVILQEDGRRIHNSIRGNLAFVEWLPDGTLLYIIDSRSGFTVWRHQENEHHLLARYDSPLDSARTDLSKEYLVLLLARQEKLSGLALNLDFKATTPLDHWPSLFPGTRLIHLEQASREIAGAADYYDDAEIAAFIESQLEEITSEATAVPERLLFTNIANLIYIDYAVPHSSDRRLLLSIRDVRLKEWAAEAAFEDRGGEWVKLTGEEPKELQIKRLYEWEPSVDQWIQKDNY